MCLKNNSMKTFRSLFYSAVICCPATFLFSCGNPSNTQSAKADTSQLPPNAEANALPYDLEFVAQTYAGKPSLPRLQSYVSAMSKDGYLLIIGGRRQGLHTFKGYPANNFIQDSSNNFLFVINPQTGDYWSFNVDSLSPELAAPLQSTNQQFYHDRTTDQCYLIGGYGWNAAKTDMLTFNTIISFKLEDLVNLITNNQPAARYAQYIQESYDNRFAVTGGALFNMNSRFYLVFGQKFTGQYRAFGGSDFKQEYTQQVRIFTLDRNSLKILSYGATTNSEPDKPFHRRDGNIIDGMDPATGEPRIAAFGGIFKDGEIAPYTYPVYITSPATPVLDRNINQKFSQYNCPVISAFDSTGNDSSKAMYHTFFGGIGHYYYFQTPSQKAAYDTVSKEGRNDGFPFVEDISTLKLSVDGSYSEYISTKPIPGNRLLGTSCNFILNDGLITSGFAYENGILNLAKLPAGKKVPIGYIYGGIEAENPLPLAPNTGTFVSNTLFTVYLTKAPTAAIPASEGHESVRQDSKLMRR
jgi:hypothetical protein